MEHRISLCKKRYTLALLCLTSPLWSMGTGDQRVNTNLGPTYTDPEGNISYKGVIFDEQGNATEVEKISFSGKTELSGIQKEDDASINEINLDMIEKLTVKESTFKSKRYNDKLFTNISIKTKTGAEEKNLLIPCCVVVSAIDTTTGIRKAWLINHIKIIDFKAKENCEKLSEEIKNSAQRPAEVQAKYHSNPLEKAVNTVRSAAASLVEKLR